MNTVRYQTCIRPVSPSFTKARFCKACRLRNISALWLPITTLKLWKIYYVYYISLSLPLVRIEKKMKNSTVYFNFVYTCTLSLICLLPYVVWIAWLIIINNSIEYLFCEYYYRWPYNTPGHIHLYLFTWSLFKWNIFVSSL